MKLDISKLIFGIYHGSGVAIDAGSGEGIYATPENMEQYCIKDNFLI